MQINQRNISRQFQKRTVSIYDNYAWEGRFLYES